MLFENAKNSKKQGDIGLGAAIAHFVSLGLTVSIPLTDSQDYDLIFEDATGILKKVQVKTTGFKAKKKYWQVSLSVKGGNKTSNTVKKFDGTQVDLLFVLTSSGDKFLIPTEAFNGKHNLTLYSPFDKFKI